MKFNTSLFILVLLSSGVDGAKHFLKKFQKHAALAGKALPQVKSVGNSNNIPTDGNPSPLNKRFVSSKNPLYFGVKGPKEPLSLMDPKITTTLHKVKEEEKQKSSLNELLYGGWKIIADNKIEEEEARNKVNNLLSDDESSVQINVEGRVPFVLSNNVIVGADHENISEKGKEFTDKLLAILDQPHSQDLSPNSVSSSGGENEVANKQSTDGSRLEQADNGEANHLLEEKEAADGNSDSRVSSEEGRANAESDAGEKENKVAEDEHPNFSRSAHVSDSSKVPAEEGEENVIVNTNPLDDINDQSTTIPVEAKAAIDPSVVEPEAKVVEVEADAEPETKAVEVEAEAEADAEPEAEAEVVEVEAETQVVEVEAGTKEEPVAKSEAEEEAEVEAGTAAVDEVAEEEAGAKSEVEEDSDEEITVGEAVSKAVAEEGAVNVNTNVSDDLDDQIAANVIPTTASDSDNHADQSATIPKAICPLAFVPIAKNKLSPLPLINPRLGKPRPGVIPKSLRVEGVEGQKKVLSKQSTDRDRPEIDGSFNLAELFENAASDVNAAVSNDEESGASSKVSGLYNPDHQKLMQELLALALKKNTHSEVKKEEEEGGGKEEEEEEEEKEKETEEETETEKVVKDNPIESSNDQILFETSKFPESRSIGGPMLSVGGFLLAATILAAFYYGEKNKNNDEMDNVEL